MTKGTLADGQWIKRAPSPYTTTQVREWLKHIGYPGITPEFDVDTFPSTLENLYTVSRLHLVKIPLDTTSLHYSADHVMAVDPQGLFHQVVKENRGSYCFGKNGLLVGMLRGLRYRVYAGQGRVNIAPMIPGAEPTYTPLTHMVLFVQPIEGSNVTYLVDTGFGGSGLACPILLSDAEDNVVMGCTPTEKHKLTRGVMPGSNTDNPPQLVWQMRVLHLKESVVGSEPNGKDDWRILYVFEETERFQRDIESANFYVSQFPYGTIFYNTLLMHKHFWIDEDGEEDEGTRIRRDAVEKQRHIGTVALLGAQLTRNIGVRREEIEEFKTEEERVKAIKEYFGIDLENAIEHIRGRPAALPQ